MRVTDLDTKEVTLTRTEKRYVLNEKIFDLDECPDWVQYAAVDKNGSVFLHGAKPRCSDSRWISSSIHILPVQCDALFDATDWQHSLIKRPEETREVTLEDLEQILGYKLKIVCGYMLDTQVFLLDNCPCWAKYAAVDHDGITSWFSDKPVLGSDNRWQLPCGSSGRLQPITLERTGEYLRFNAENYRHSTVKKEAHLNLQPSGA